MVARTDLELEPSSTGVLRVWEQPEPGRKYLIGADTAGGLAKGDFAVGAVIDGETCALVAGIRARHHPHLFGKELAYLGWWYNGAVLGIETWPSTHGATAAQIARQLGYPAIYVRRTHNTVSKRILDEIGWRTDSSTKPRMIDRIKIGLEDELDIPDEVLLRELREQRLDEKGEMVSFGNDDYVIAYSIALMVRDECWSRGMLRVEAKAPVTESEKYWAREDAKRGIGVKRPRPRWVCG